MLKIRLARIGKKKQPLYRIIVSESSRDTYGKFLELLGHYNPFSKVCEVKKDRIEYWISKGAKKTRKSKNENERKLPRQLRLSRKKKKKSHSRKLNPRKKKKLRQLKLKIKSRNNFNPCPRQGLIYFLVVIRLDYKVMFISLLPKLSCLLCCSGSSSLCFGERLIFT